jgi:hypothetical protein
MTWWGALLDLSGAVLLMLVGYGAGLMVRRRFLARNGGTFELSHRIRGGETGHGWALGMGRYSGDRLEWFRIFSLALRPRAAWDRHALTYDGRREPLGVEQASLYPDHVVIRCQQPGGGLVELAMSEASLTGFQAWLEAQSPGTDWNR